jgi:uncharacterized membrane protein
MFKDRIVIWVLEYIFGGILVVVPMAGLASWRVSWIDAHIWAVELFVACLGVILISCASSMRQRMLLARRIETLAEQMREYIASSQEPATTKGQND